LAEGKVQLSSDEWKKEIDGICKAIIKKMEGAKREERSGLFPFFRVIQIYPVRKPRVSRPVRRAKLF
jgi:hypothetical protein